MTVGGVVMGIAKLECAVALLALVAGCDAGEGAPGEPDGAIPPAGELSLGGADDDGTGFVELGDGDDAPLIAGAQGGFHIWTGLRARGIAGTVHLVREARRVSDGALVLRAPAQVIEVPIAAMEAWWERPDASASFMCPTPVGIQIRDQELVLRAELLSPDDELLAEDELIVVPRCPRGDLAAFCAEICSG